MARIAGNDLIPVQPAKPERIGPGPSTDVGAYASPSPSGWSMPIRLRKARSGHLTLDVQKADLEPFADVNNDELQLLLSSIYLKVSELPSARMDIDLIRGLQRLDEQIRLMELTHGIRTSLAQKG